MRLFSDHVEIDEFPLPVCRECGEIIYDDAPHHRCAWVYLDEDDWRDYCAAHGLDPEKEPD